MDWTTIGYITLASIVFIIHFIPIQRRIYSTVDSRVLSIFAAAALTLSIAYFEVFLLLGLYKLGVVISAWGIGNFLLSAVIVTTIVGGPYIAKPLALRLFVAVPHYIKKFFADCKTYKTELETKQPTKRSIYDLMEE